MKKILQNLVYFILIVLVGGLAFNSFNIAYNRIINNKDEKIIYLISVYNFEGKLIKSDSSYTEPFFDNGLFEYVSIETNLKYTLINYSIEFIETTIDNNYLK